MEHEINNEHVEHVRVKCPENKVIERQSSSVGMGEGIS